MGRFQTEQPLLRKEGVRPPLAAAPNTAFAPLFEGRQHSVGPDRWFDPVPRTRGRACLFSPVGHCRRLLVHQSVPPESTFLRPLAPPELPGFSATMGALTPDGRMTPGCGRVSLLSALPRAAGQVSLGLARPRRHTCPGGSELIPGRSPFLTTTDLRPIPPPTTNCPPGQDIWGRTAPGRHHLGFTTGMEARQDSRPNRVHLRCGLGLHLGLLSTPSREDAVTSGYRPSRSGRARTSTLLTVALEGAHPRLKAGGFGRLVAPGR